MKNTVLTFSLLRGVIKSAFIAIVGAFVLLAIIGTLFGYGPFLGLYYASLIILYVASLGLLVGGFITAICLIRRPVTQGEHPGNSSARYGVNTYAAWIGLPLLLILGLVIVPYLTINVNREVRHGTTWTTETRPACPTHAVILMLVKYAEYEVVCSAELFQYLQSQKDDVVPITFRVTYDFGEPRSFQLIAVGPIEITWSEWLDSARGCGGEYLPACNSPETQNGSPLYESSWSGK